MTNQNLALILCAAVGAGVIGLVSLALITTTSCDDPEVLELTQQILEDNFYGDFVTVSGIVEEESVGTELVRCTATATVGYEALNLSQSQRIVYTAKDTADGQLYVQVRKAE